MIFLDPSLSGISSLRSCPVCSTGWLLGMRWFFFATLGCPLKIPQLELDDAGCDECMQRRDLHHHKVKLFVIFLAAQYMKNITGSQIGRESKAEIHDVMCIYIYIIYTSFIIKILWAKSCWAVWIVKTLEIHRHSLRKFTPSTEKPWMTCLGKYHTIIHVHTKQYILGTWQLKTFSKIRGAKARSLKPQCYSRLV